MMRFGKVTRQGVRQLLQPAGVYPRLSATLRVQHPVICLAKPVTQRKPAQSPNTLNSCLSYRFERGPDGSHLLPFINWDEDRFQDRDKYICRLASDCKKRGRPVKAFREEVHDAELGRLGDKPWIPLCSDIKQKCADPDLLGPGIYEIGIQAPGSNNIVPVYFGRAGTSNADSARCIRDRVLEHCPRPYRPKYLDDILAGTRHVRLPRLRTIIADLKARGFSVFARAIRHANPIGSEKIMLEKYDYAFNDAQNGPGLRMPILEEGDIKDFPYIIPTWTVVPLTPVEMPYMNAALLLN